MLHAQNNASVMWKSLPPDHSLLSSSVWLPKRGYICSS